VDRQPLRLDGLAARVADGPATGTALLRQAIAVYAPLALAPEIEDASLEDANEFGFADDPYGYLTPFGAHIRRGNPRDWHIFNPAAFQDPNINVSTTPGTPYVFGEMPRTTSEWTTQPFFNEDFSFLKRTPLFEGQNLTFKAEMYNAFNRHIFGTLDGSVGFNNSAFGVPKGDRGTINAIRQIQITLRYQF